MSNNHTDLFKGYANIRHDTRPISVNCPRCLIESSTPGRKKTYKNLAALDSHLSTQHKDEFWTKEARLLMMQFAEVLIK